MLLWALFVFAASVQLKFESLSEDDVVVDPQRKLPALSFWLNKNNYNSQQAQLWCLTRMCHCLLVLNTKMEILVFWVLLVVKVISLAVYMWNP